MQFNYFIPLISFFGLIFGIILSKVAEEELEGGRVYFEWFKRIVLVLLGITLILNARFSLNSLMYFIVGGLIGYLSSFYIGRYFYLGIASVLGFLFIEQVFFIIGVLVFLFGLPFGSLFRRNKFRELYKSFLLFIIPFLSLIFVLNNLGFEIVNLLIGISVGGFLKEFVRRKFISF